MTSNEDVDVLAYRPGPELRHAITTTGEGGQAIGAAEARHEWRAGIA